MSLKIINIVRSFKEWRTARRNINSLCGQVIKKGLGVDVRTEAEQISLQAAIKKSAFSRLLIQSSVLTAALSAPLLVYVLSEKDADVDKQAQVTVIAEEMAQKIEMNELNAFFSARKERMENDIEPGVTIPLLWAKAAYVDGWRIDQLRIIDEVAAIKLKDNPFVKPSLGLYVGNTHYRSFIKCRTPRTASELPEIQLNFNYDVAVMSKAEWEDMFDHEINHAKLRQTNLIRRDAYKNGKISRMKLGTNFIRLLRRNIPSGEQKELDALFAEYCSILSLQGLTKAKSLNDLGMTLDEVLADLMIENVTDATRSRYAKVINKLIEKNKILEGEWIARAKMIGDHFGAPIDIFAAESKRTGNPALDKILIRIIEMTIGSRERILAYIKKDLIR